MKKTIRTLAVILALVLSMAIFASCGNKPAEPDGTDAPATPTTSSDEIKGAVDEHGYYKVFVPEGYTLKHEDVFGDNDPKSFNLNNDESSFDYFMFNMYSEDNVKSSIDMTKEMNDGAKDVTVDINGVTWTGVAYDSVGIACFSLYADFDGNFVIVSGAGNEYDSALVKTVLGSLEVNVTE